MKTTIRRVLAAAFLWAAFAAYTIAGEASFYKGKTLTVLINFAVGGPTDIEGHLIEGVAVAYMRKDVPPGIKEPRDIGKAQRFRAGGLSLNSAKVGPEGEKLVKKITQAPPEVKNTVRKYTESQ